MPRFGSVVVAGTVGALLVLTVAGFIRHGRGGEDHASGVLGSPDLMDTTSPASEAFTHERAPAPWSTSGMLGLSYADSILLLPREAARESGCAEPCDLASFGLRGDGFASSVRTTDVMVDAGPGSTEDTTNTTRRLGRAGLDGSSLLRLVDMMLDSTNYLED